MESRLLKGELGFEFSLVCREDTDRKQYSKIQNVIPHGTAYLDSKLQTDDLLD